MRQALQSLLAPKGGDDGLWTGASEDMIALHTPDGRFARVSQSSQTVCGHDADDLVGRPLSEIVSPQDRGVVFAAMSRAVYDGTPGRAEFRILKGDGSVGWVDMTISRDVHGAIRTVIRDSSDQRAQLLARNAACLQAEAQLASHTNYLADLSHEIRTPLNAVIGFAEMMRHQTFGPLGHPKYEEYAGLIHKSGQHLLALVSGLLDLSKIEAERYRLNRSATDLPALVRDCAEMSRLGAEEAGLELVVDLQPMEGKVMVDSKVIRQIVLNLLSNAIKFTERGAIEVRLRHDEETVWISVIDTGIGMSQAQLDNVGRRFTSAQRDGVRGARGTGLGLALCDALARLHEGDLRLASREGRGTRSVVSIPYMHQHEAEDPAEEEAGPVQVDRVLAEDDTKEALDALGRHLEHLIATDGKAGDNAGEGKRRVA